MAHSLAFLAVLSFGFLIGLTTQQQLETSQTQIMLQVWKQLEYPVQMAALNGTKDVCALPPSPSLDIGCKDTFITELKVVGDRLTRPDQFDGRPIPRLTLSPNFSVDSFVTTLARLSSLKVVVLVNLGIWGSLPDKIHRLSSLEVLNLSSNFLCGSIPPRISAMGTLQTLALDENFFDGTVPDWLDSLSNLSSLSLRGNRLTGPLPKSIARMRTLTSLGLSDNEISGELPDLSGLASLEVLDFRGNRLDAVIPPLPPGVVTLLLSRNSFTGEIPQQVGKLIRLQHLDLSFNLLRGTPLVSLFSLPNVTFLNLANNMLSGSIPKGATCSRQLGFVDISANKLTGGLPSCLSDGLIKGWVNVTGNCLSVDSKSQHEDSYCKEVESKGGGSKGRSVGELVGITGGSIILVLFCMIVLVNREKYCRRSVVEEHLLHTPKDTLMTAVANEHMENGSPVPKANKLVKQMPPTYRVFSLEELQEATKNFSESSYIGEGSNGKIYKGRLENGVNVAIKCLSFFKRCPIRNLKLRLDLLSKLRHPHLVCLLGHCIDGFSDGSSVNRVFLIYEYMPNGNLHGHLSENSLDRALKWPDRLAILIGVAKAVQFLHTGVIPGFMNNRLKTTSILLNEHRIAKVSDYGLSIITEERDRHEEQRDGSNLTQSIQNKYSLWEVTNFEDDIYMFGLILLETLVGHSMSEKGEAYFLAEMATSSGNQDKLKLIVDPLVLSTANLESLSISISLTNKCVSPDPSHRPSMEDILWNLQYAAQLQASADGDQTSDVASQP